MAIPRPFALSNNKRRSTGKLYHNFRKEPTPTSHEYSSSSQRPRTLIVGSLSSLSIKVALRAARGQGNGRRAKQEERAAAARGKRQREERKAGGEESGRRGKREEREAAARGEESGRRGKREEREAAARGEGSGSERRGKREEREAGNNEFSENEWAEVSVG
ncbi:hypothetical protein K474DRAFT_1679156 [Panus rudis PR-1116 ss-1]|nr:hypothetical protein K474DRAFT_1679156 [Panus rudis PR-1116 ss-1]